MQTDTHANEQIYRWTDIFMGRYTYRQTGIKTDKSEDGQKCGWAIIQKNKLKDRQKCRSTDIYMDIDTHTDGHT